MENNLEFLMLKEGIGPTELSRLVDVSRNTIQRILRKENASFETMLKIARYFEKDVEDIFYKKCTTSNTKIKKTQKLYKEATSSGRPKKVGIT